jgi:hypothetical protein
VILSPITPTIGLVAGEQTAPRLASVPLFWKFLSPDASCLDA